MKIYAAHGCHDFVLLLGYKGDVIRDFFLNGTGGTRAEVSRDDSNCLTYSSGKLRTLARDAGGHRRKGHDRRAALARPALSGIGWRFWPDLRRRRRQH